MHNGKLFNIAATGGILLAAGIFGQARAADVVPATTPGIAGTIGGGYQYTDFGGDLGGGADISADSFFGDGAVVMPLSDSMFNVQIDGAYNNHRLTDGTDDFTLEVWHAGGALFYRDTSWGLFGLDGAIGGISVDGESIDTYRAGVRGEAYLGDTATLSARAGYTNLSVSGNHIDGPYGELGASFYLMPNLALRPEFEYVHLSVGGDSADLYSVGAEAELGLDELTGVPVALFGGGRYWDLSADGANINETQGFVGIRIYFGSGNTLIDHHRGGSLDNTDSLLEKGILPL
jgi:hypothetical protein